MTNRNRMAEVFKTLVQIDSISKEETRISDHLIQQLQSLGAEVVTDTAGEKVGGAANNIIARFKGTADVEPMLLCAHMDTVEPGRGIQPALTNGVFSSTGETILGADDKSAIAIILEVLEVLKENHLHHGPLEVVFTICEEIGLLGAKNMDYSLISAKFGYALDGSDTEGIVTRAPAANNLEFTIHGKDAHAGAAPEKGINAIMLAAKALSDLEIGRIDQETTCNIGVVEGGKATNIVPNKVVVKGEVRSHDKAKLDRVTSTIAAAFKTAVENYKPKSDGLPRLEVNIIPEFPQTHVPDDHPMVVLAQKAAKNLGRAIRTKISGGGADANIFFEKGIMTGVLGTGMRDMHTTRESVALEDMEKTAALVLEIIRLHATA